MQGVRVNSLKYIYENESLENEPVIDRQKKVNYNNLNHIHTTDQMEVYDLIEEWHAVVDQPFIFTNRYERIFCKAFFLSLIHGLWQVLCRHLTIKHIRISFYFSIERIKFEFPFYFYDFYDHFSLL